MLGSDWMVIRGRGGEGRGREGGRGVHKKTTRKSGARQGIYVSNFHGTESFALYRCHG